MIRQEIKFILDDNFKLYNLKKKLNIKMLHKERIINSIYFDTNDYKFFYQSEEGITPRFKVRIRYYNFDKQISYEIKTTHDYHRSKIVEKQNRHTKKFMENFLNKNKIQIKLYPKLLVKYKRNYFKSEYGRITLDREIKYQKVNYKMENIGSEFLENSNVLELKHNESQIDKNKLLNYIGCPETRNSKYCNGINILSQKKHYFAS